MKHQKPLMPSSAVTFASLTLTSLTASRLVASDAAKLLVSVADLSAWVKGTSNQITSTPAAGQVTLSTPQDIAAASSPTFAGLTLSGVKASRLLFLDATNTIDDVGDLSTWVIGTANRITSTPGAGVTTLSTPQDLDTACDFQAATQTLSGNMTLTAGGSIVSTAAGNIDLTPDTTGITNIGSATTVRVDAAKGLLVGDGTPTITMTGGDLFVTAHIQNFGAIYTSDILAQASIRMRFGGTEKFRIQTSAVADPTLFGLSANKTIAIGDFAYYLSNPDLADLGYSSLAMVAGDPGVSNNRYGRSGHDGANFRSITGLTTGTGTGPVTIDNGFIFAPRTVDKVIITGRGGMAYIPAADQTLAAADLIALTGHRVRVVGSGGAVTLTGTPSIEAGEYDGQELVIQGTDDTNTITIQDVTSLAGTTFSGIGSVDVTLGKGDTVRVSWDSGESLWYEQGRANV